MLSSLRKVAWFQFLSCKLTWRQDSKVFPTCWNLIGQIQISGKPAETVSLFRTVYVKTQISKEAFVCIILQTFFATRTVLKNMAIVTRIFSSFSRGIFSHVTRLDKSCTIENIWCIVRAVIPCSKKCYIYAFSSLCLVLLYFQSLFINTIIPLSFVGCNHLRWIIVKYLKNAENITPLKWFFHHC